MRIIAFGDVHMNVGRFSIIPNISEADLVIITGDITNFGTDSDTQKIISQISMVNNRLLDLPGNLDRDEVDLFLSRRKINLHGRGIRLTNIDISGVGGSNQTTFNIPNELSESDIESLLTSGYETIKSAAHHILDSHTPPIKTTPDRVDNGNHVGSPAVRNFIGKKEPAFCICSHIHEARSEDRIGTTQILNPGMIKNGGYIEMLVFMPKSKPALENSSEHNTREDYGIPS